MNVVTLPLPDGTLAPFRLSEATPFSPGSEPFPRVAYAAAHVVADPAVDVARLLRDPDRAADRMRAFCATQGVA
jgi:hypothetical protein